MSNERLISTNVVGEEPLTKLPKHEIDYITDYKLCRHRWEERAKRHGKIQRKRGAKYDK